MSRLAVLLGVAVLLHRCALVVSEEHEATTSHHASGASSTMSNEPLLTPLPQSETRQYLGNYPFPSFTPGYRPQKCPLCDNSVYPYCGEKLFHDACCCTDSHHDLPYQCRLADCRFLHANGCREHRLIANCCCSDDYRVLLKALVARR